MNTSNTSAVDVMSVVALLAGAWLICYGATLTAVACPVDLTRVK